MMHPTTMILLARNLMNQHGLYDWTVTLDGAKQRAGLCNYSRKTISLSRYVNPLRPDEDVENTILHEIAHALVGPGHGHGIVWEKMARNIGCDGQRCYEITESNKVQGNWRGVCPGGHNHGERFRRPKNGKRYSCKECNPGGGFNAAYLIRWVAI